MWGFLSSARSLLTLAPRPPDWSFGHKAKVWQLDQKKKKKDNLKTFTTVTIYRKLKPSSHQFLQTCITVWFATCDTRPSSETRETTPPCGYWNKGKNLDKLNVSDFTLVIRWVSQRTDNFVFAGTSMSLLSTAIDSHWGYRQTLRNFIVFALSVCI